MDEILKKLLRKLHCSPQHTPHVLSQVKSKALPCSVKKTRISKTPECPTNIVQMDSIVKAAESVANAQATNKLLNCSSRLKLRELAKPSYGLDTGGYASTVSCTAAPPPALGSRWCMYNLRYLCVFKCRAPGEDTCAVRRGHPLRLELPWDTFSSKSRGTSLHTPTTHFAACALLHSACRKRMECARSTACALAEAG